MRRLATTALAVSLAALLAGCGKSQSQSQDQNAQATSTEQPANPQSTSAVNLKAAQASLPAPYDTADLANGEAKFAMCASCHTIAAGGPNMTGPNLHGVVGRKSAGAPNFNYSDALKATGLTWDAAHLDKWLTDPRALVPGTKMSFVGLKDPKDRTDVIAYLMVNK